MRELEASWNISLSTHQHTKQHARNDSEGWSWNKQHVNWVNTLSLASICLSLGWNWASLGEMSQEDGGETAVPGACLQLARGNLKSNLENEYMHTVRKAASVLDDGRGFSYDGEVRVSV